MSDIELDVDAGRLKIKGRGHRNRQDGNDSEIGRGGAFESVGDSAKGAHQPACPGAARPHARARTRRGTPECARHSRAARRAGGPIKSVEGWIARRAASVPFDLGFSSVDAAGRISAYITAAPAAAPPATRSAVWDLGTILVSGAASSRKSMARSGECADSTSESPWLRFAHPDPLF